MVKVAANVKPPLEFILKKLLLLIPFLSLPIHAAPELKGSPSELKQFLHPKENIITITRTAEEVVYKDVAIVSLVVTTEEDELAEALNENTQLRTKISAVLLKAGIPLKDINNAKFSTSPDYGWFGNKPDSYKVSNIVAVRINNEKALQSIAQIVDNNNEVTLLKTEYEHAKKEEYINKVKTKALDKVLKEKDFYAKKLGIQLLPVSFRDDNANPQHDVQLMETRSYRSSKMKESVSAQASTRQKTSFEKIIYKARVSVSFKVK